MSSKYSYNRNQSWTELARIANTLKILSGYKNIHYIKKLAIKKKLLDEKKTLLKKQEEEIACSEYDDTVYIKSSSISMQLYASWYWGKIESTILPKPKENFQTVSI
jgi:hypothetical protein